MSTVAGLPQRHSASVSGLALPMEPPMIRHILSIAAAVVIATPTVASACTLNQHDSRTVVMTAASTDCKFSDKEVKQLQAQLSQALASLPAHRAMPAVVATSHTKTQQTSATKRASAQSAIIDNRTSKQRRQFVEMM